MEEKIVTILNEMAEYLLISQMKKLQEVLLKKLNEKEVEKKRVSNVEYLSMFIAAKSIEGCSKRTVDYYRTTKEKIFKKTEIPIRKITTEDMRNYLSEYQKINDCSKVTVDNIRRNISSFFSSLEEENYILKSPMKRIHKIKANQMVKDVISDEDIEKLRDHCKCKRDLAMIDLLYSTGMRVGELVNLNISDVDFEARECVVFGKGGKERRVYFDAKAKLHLQAYIASRKDDNPALFVTLDAPSDRLKISGVEIRIRELGRGLNLTKIHPHKFRRTMATRAIRAYNPIHSQFGGMINKPIKYLLEDVLEKDSKESYYIQICDFVSYFVHLYYSVYYLKKDKPKRVSRLIDDRFVGSVMATLKASGVLNLKANSANEYGLVIYPK